jgi:hypothetical protein
METEVNRNKVTRKLRSGFSQSIPLTCFFLLASLIPVRVTAQSKSFKHQVLEQIAAQHYNPTFSAIAARLKLGINKDIGLKQLDTLLKKEYGDMFWMYGCTGLYFSTKKILPPAYKKKIKECWKKFTPYRGDTENHFLMYYSSLYLMSQEWPNLPRTAWFLGKSSKEINNEARNYLDSWINRAVKFGQIEFDSPRYLYYFITPLILLSEYTKERTMKIRCRMMLEFLLADYAAKYLDGNFCGAHSRISNEQAFDTRNAESASYGDYFFEDSVRHLFPDIAFAAMSSFKIPEIIRDIASDRKEPYSIHAIRRSRDAIRFTPELNSSVYDYTFTTKDYSLGSIGGGLVQPIQQRSWSLTICSEQKNNIIFGLHQYVSEKELGMYFPEEPSFMIEKIEGVKNGYTSENKWVGGSPYEKIKQCKNEIECTYDIPSTEKYQHVDIFLPGWGNFLEQDSSRIRIQYDSCVVEIAPQTSYTLIPDNGNFRMRLLPDSGKTGYFLSCNRVDTFNDFDTSVTFCAKDDMPPDLKKEDWLYYSKFLESKLGTGILKMKNGTHERILDFTANTIR